METTESFFSDGFDLELLKQPGFFGLGALESVDQGQNVGGIFFRKTYSLAELVKIADRNAAGFLQFEHGEIGTGNSMIQKIGKIGQWKVPLCKKNVKCKYNYESSEQLRKYKIFYDREKRMSSDTESK